jgi:hypothetical protein
MFGRGAEIVLTWGPNGASIPIFVVCGAVVGAQ